MCHPAILHVFSFENGRLQHRKSQKVRIIMEYIVSARKYRPRSFDAVVGQEALTTTLKKSVQTGKLAHAYLFCGPRGVGKTTCARIFAKAINCMNPSPEGNPCETCESCLSFNEQRNYNIHELDAASNNSVDDIRELIQQAQIPPQVGKYKVFIIDEVHMLSPGAFNAFLKTLEEPPAHVIFILATTEKNKLLPTILSRCQIYDFKRMEVNDIVRHLEFVAGDAGITYEVEALNVIAQKADGGMRDALSIFDQVASFTDGNITYQKVIENLNVLDYEYYFSMTTSLLKTDIKQVLLTFNEVLSKGFDAQNIIGGLATHFRNLLMSQSAETTTLLDVPDTVRARYKEQAAACAPKFLYTALKRCSECDINYRTSNNKRLLVELTLIEIAQAAAGDDSPGSGLGPTQKILKPIFQNGNSRQVKNNTPQQVQKTQPAQPDTTQSTTQSAKPAQNYSQTTGTTSAPKVSEPAPKNSFGVKGGALSIQALRKRSQTQGDQQQNTKDAAANASESQATDIGTRIFTQEDLTNAWLKYANQLPREEKATAERMKNMQPTLLDECRVDVIIDNGMLMEIFQNISDQIQTFLQRTLDNRDLRLELRLREYTDKRKAYSQKEQWAEVVEKRPALLDFSRKHKLELA